MAQIDLATARRFSQALNAQTYKYLIEGVNMETEITWGKATKVWWSIMWRNLIAIFAAMIIGGIIGGIMGVIMGAAGVPVETIQIIAAPIGFIIGIAVSIVPIKMVLGKSYGDFRLVLVENTNA